jgi:hypothetical protein
MGEEGKDYSPAATQAFEWAQQQLDKEDLPPVRVEKDPGRFISKDEVEKRLKEKGAYKDDDVLVDRNEETGELIVSIYPHPLAEDPDLQVRVPAREDPRRPGQKLYLSLEVDTSLDRDYTERYL